MYVHIYNTHLSLCIANFTTLCTRSILIRSVWKKKHSCLKIFTSALQKCIIFCTKRLSGVRHLYSIKVQFVDKHICTYIHIFARSAIIDNFLMRNFVQNMQIKKQK